MCGGGGVKWVVGGGGGARGGIQIRVEYLITGPQASEVCSVCVGGGGGGVCCKGYWGWVCTHVWASEVCSVWGCVVRGAGGVHMFRDQRCVVCGVLGGVLQVVPGVCTCLEIL